MKHSRKIRAIILHLAVGIFLVFNSHQAVSQQIRPDQINFSTIKVDELTDAQVNQFIRRAETSGMTLQELEAEAIARGMPYTEVLKLRQRISTLQQVQRPPQTPERDALRTLTGPEPTIPAFLMDTLEEEKDEFRVFGHDLFRRENLSFEPSLNIPTPSNYVVGPGDELAIEVWGASQQSYRVPVSPEGQISIQNLGLIRVGGMTIERASELIISRLSTIYSGLRGPNANTFAQVSIGNIRSIKVTLAGDVYMPGTYTLPAFATIFNALYVAGGPADNGSFREIRVVRDGKTFTQTDLYDFLLKGETSLNIRLRDEDLVFVGPYINHISFAGEVKRPAIYELRDNETLADLVRYSGGFSPKAYQKRLVVDRKSDNQRQLLSVESELFSSFLMKNGDSIFVEPVLERYENRVSIQGAVFREGDFGLVEGMTLSQLIDKAEGLREDAFASRAALYRLRDNLEVQVINFNVGDVLSGKEPDIVLQREDLVMISSMLELQQERTVRIIGEIQKSGEYPYAHNITLGELIRKAGGLNEAASLARVEVARRVSNPMATIMEQQITRVFTFALDKDLSLSDEASSFVLHPFDMVFVRRSPGYQMQQLTQIKGEVIFPGSYAISNKNERISDLINRAGGLTEEAYIAGATLTRRVEDESAERLRRLAALESGDTEIFLDTLETRQQQIGINLERILRQPRSQFDLILMDGDILNIPLQLQTVRMTGAVLHPTSAIYSNNLGVRGYVSRAGGFAGNAQKNKVYVLYPNGSVDRTRNYLLFRNYPSIEPGAEIIVPQKPERERRTLQETIAISSAVTSLALVIVTLIGRL
jgi:protein involved in polysaccharide export with SLBB domain